MQALVLAGGLGTRLRPLTWTRAKPLVPIGLVPMVLRVLEHLRAYSVTEVILATSSENADDLSRALRQSPLPVRIVAEETPQGTAGAAKNAEPLLDDTFLVADADVLSDLALDQLWQFHKERKAAATIAVVPSPDPSRFGTVLWDAEGRVTAFLEKVPPADKALSWVNSGFYIWEKNLLHHIPSKQPSSVERDLYPELIRQQVPLFACRPTHSYWRDVGVLEDYCQIHWDLLTGQAPFPLPVQKIQESVWAGQTHISPAAEIRPPVVVGDDSSIAAGATVGPFVVIGPGCTIKEKAFLERTILWEECTVGEKALVKNCVLASRCQVLPGAHLVDRVSEGGRVLG
ncbi:MAG: NDP-sugar synthase [Armatimonadetes bacterium]|nr:NDP-sugar synthase [Armatimonadota bacterium]MDW8122550.1 NDP-sugar synthase [Armatimonadota bacterium]